LGVAGSTDGKYVKYIQNVIGKPEGKNNLGDLAVHERILLECMLKE
jgi:hypothetical protein